MIVINTVYVYSAFKKSKLNKDIKRYYKIQPRRVRVQLEIKNLSTLISKRSLFKVSITMLIYLKQLKNFKYSRSIYAINGHMMNKFPKILYPSHLSRLQVLNKKPIKFVTTIWFFA